MVWPARDESKVMVPPEAISATAWRREPGPLSFVLRTMIDIGHGVRVLVLVRVAVRVRVGVAVGVAVEVADRVGVAGVLVEERVGDPVGVLEGGYSMGIEG